MAALLDFPYGLRKLITYLLTGSSHLLSRVRMVKRDTRLKRDFGKDPENLLRVYKPSQTSSLEIKSWKYGTQKSLCRRKTQGQAADFKHLEKERWMRDGSGCPWGSGGQTGQSREGLSSVKMEAFSSVTMVEWAASTRAGLRALSL